MSSPSSDIEHESPGPATKKPRTDASADEAAAATPRAADHSTDILILERLDALGKELVTVKEEHKKELNAVKEELNAVKEEHKKELNAVKEELGTVKGRMDCFVTAFAPASQYALFETAIYEFLERVIPDDWVAEKDKILFGITTMCSAVMEQLLSNKFSAGKNSWQGPATRVKGGNRAFPKPYKRPLVLAGLAGLKCFIDTVTDIDGWDPKHRNATVHNGRFLKPMFPASPTTGNESSLQYEQQKEEIARVWEAFKMEAGTYKPPENIEAAVNGIVLVLGEEGISIDDGVKKEVCKALHTATADA